MSRTLSAAAVRGVLAQQTAEIYLMLLTITGTEETPIRVVNNYEDITSNGDLYKGFPFKFQLPGESAESLPVVNLQIDNVSKLLVQGVRETSAPPDVTLDVVLASSPDTIEIGPLIFKMVKVNYNADMLTGTCNFHDILNQPYPAGSYTPASYPGLF